MGASDTRMDLGALERALSALDPSGERVRVVPIGGEHQGLRVSPLDLEMTAAAVRTVGELGGRLRPVSAAVPPASESVSPPAILAPPVPAAGVTPPPVLLDTSRLTGIVDYPIGDLTVTVRAGTRCAELDQILAAEGQWLPIDVPDAGTTTVGSMLATAPAGPRRLGYGTLRDYLIGITVVDGCGRVVRSGGRVVKNVAGYDLGKLYLGSRGSLAVIADATFKLLPRPECTRLWVGALPRLRLVSEVTQAVRESAARPTAVEVLLGSARGLVAADAAAGDRGEATLCLLLEGSEVEVRWQEQRLARALGSIGVLTRDVRVDAEAWTFGARVLEVVRRDGEVGVRCAVLPGHVTELLATLLEVGASGVVAGPATGVVRATLAASAPIFARVRDAVHAASGYVHVDHLPATVDAAEFPPTPAPPSARALAARLKRALDPSDVLPPIPGGAAEARPHEHGVLS